MYVWGWCCVEINMKKTLKRYLMRCKGGKTWGKDVTTDKKRKGEKKHLKATEKIERPRERNKRYKKNARKDVKKG